MMSVKNRRNSSIAKGGGNEQSNKENNRNHEDENANQGIDKTYILPDPTKLTCWGKIQN